MKQKNKNSNRYKYIILGSILFLVVVLASSISQENIKRQILNTYTTIDEEILQESDKNDIIKYLEEKGNMAEIYFIQGYYLLNKNKLQDAKTNFIKALDNIDSSTYYLTETHINKYLATIAIKNNNYSEAKEYILNSFKSIQPKYYDESINIIIRISELCQETKQLRNTGIEILEKVNENEQISDKSRLLILEELSLLYFINNQYSNSSEVNLNYIMLANDSGNKVEYAKGLIYLGTLFNELKGNETAIESIKEALNVDIEDDKQRGIVQSYGYLNLGEIYSDLGMYEEAIDAVDEISRYKEYYNDEDYRDYEILVSLVKARCYINLDRLDEAKEFLDKSKELLDIDKDIYFIDKSIEYKVVNGNYLVSKGEYKNAIEEYKEVLSKAEAYGNLYIQEQILKEIVKVYAMLEDDENYNFYTKKLLDLKGCVEELRYEDYSKYIIQSTLDKQSMKSAYEARVNVYRILMGVVVIAAIVYYFISRKINKMNYLTQRDGLTGVYNRRQFDKVYENLKRKRDDFACVLIDIDNFKSINDTYGHAFGDEVLIRLCEVVESKLKHSGHLYRYGGEEFVILINRKSIDEVIEIAETCRKSVSNIDFEDGIRVTVSIGVATFDENGEGILVKADENLYEAKRTGKNKVVYK